MNTIVQDVQIGTIPMRPHHSYQDSVVPTVIWDHSDSIVRTLAVAKPKFDHSRTTGLHGSLVLWVHAPTELVRARRQLQEPSDEDKLHAKLFSYPELPHDWDGRGAVPPSPSAVRDAISFLDKRPSDVPLPFPQIASDGEVGLYWRTGEIHIEIGFYGDGELSYYARYTPASGKSKECGRDGYSLGAKNWPQDLMLILNKL